MLKTIAMISLGLMSVLANGEIINQKIEYHNRTLYVSKLHDCKYMIKRYFGDIHKYAKILDLRDCNAWQPEDGFLECTSNSTDIYCINAFKIIDIAKTQEVVANQERYRIKVNEQRKILHQVIGE